MDNFGVDFTVSSSPLPPVPEPEPIPEPEGPSEVDVLRQQLEATNKELANLRSAKDSHINQINERVNLLDSMLQDQLAQKGPEPQASVPQPALEEDNFWSNYFGQGKRQTQPESQQIQESVKETPQVEPKDIRKIAREELKTQAAKAHENLLAQQKESADLKERFASEYKHLHPVADKVTALFNEYTALNPNLSQTERFNRAVAAAERLFPVQHNTPQAPGLPTGGQTMPTAYPGATGMNRPMVNGFPVRDAAAARESTNNHVYELKQARQKRMRKGLV